MVADDVGAGIYAGLVLFLLTYGRCFMKIGILTIGNELMSGRIADTNSSFIAREINLQGWNVEA